MRGNIEAADMYNVNSENNDAVRQIRACRAQGFRLYYFVPDFASDEGLWRNVIRAYLRAYSANDKTAFILLLEESDAAAQLGEIGALLAALGTDAPLVLACVYADTLLLCSRGMCFLRRKRRFLFAVQHLQVRLVQRFNMPGIGSRMRRTMMSASVLRPIARMRRNSLRR